ncbi:unnamed protein product [Angiostrongylus costaricensis]|uniref:Uncharacterized protein n=1 Tax=Angiostrongylus costaricensis TaxID=334426 RepID=A0A0R3PXX5_ANGCS|nr:unnamed protein product [Angiostrongylus costaricensis]
MAIRGDGSLLAELTVGVVNSNFCGLETRKVQGAADLIAVANFVFCVTIRRNHLCDDFYRRHESFLGTWCFAQYYILEIMRIFGILLITVQRYVGICRNGSAIDEQFAIFGLRSQLSLYQAANPFYVARKIIAAFVSCNEIIAGSHSFSVKYCPRLTDRNQKRQSRINITDALQIPEHYDNFPVAELQQAMDSCVYAMGVAVRLLDASYRA